MKSVIGTGSCIENLIISSPEKIEMMFLVGGPIVLSHGTKIKPGVYTIRFRDRCKDVDTGRIELFTVHEIVVVKEACCVDSCFGAELYGDTVHVLFCEI